MFTLREACRYSLVPHQLGFCGPTKDCSKILADYINQKNISRKQIKKILKQFKAVYFYCRKIAGANQIKDPLSSQVLEAYWIGNDLLPKARYKNGGYPHHSYHVWQAVPFNPAIKLTERLKKLCQVSAKKAGSNYYAYHWGKRIQKLNKNQIKNLKYYTEINQCLKKKK